MNDLRLSQHDIERYLDERFKVPGYFLEIGCWKGDLISQTYYLEKNKGWTGLCVDPFPYSFEKRTCKLCKKAISGDGKVREFVRVSIDRRYGGDVSYFSGFKDSIQTHWDLISEFCDYEIIGLETITFTQLAEIYVIPQFVEFLSVDTEGSELEIFQTIPFDKFSFGLIVFEHNRNDVVKNEVGEILVKNGYHLLEALQVDDVYVRNVERS
jgi:hypothetical protein